MTLRTLFLIAPALALCACTSISGDRPFGQAYTEQYNQQLVNEAYAAPTPVEGLDGHVAQRAIQNHRDPKEDEGPSFAKVLESMMDK